MAIAYGFNPEGGTKNYSFSTYDSHSELCDALVLSKGYRRAKQGAQFFIVTHSPILLGLPGVEILSFDDGRVHPCAYENTESLLCDNIIDC